MDKSQCDVLTRFDSDDSPEDAECAAAEEKALTDILQKLAFVILFTITYSCFLFG